MATLNLSATIPDEKQTEIVDALAYAYGYSDQIRDENGDLIDNPTTKGQHIKNSIISELRSKYVRYLRGIAYQTASQSLPDGSDIS